MVSNTPRPHFTPGKDPVPIVQEAGWAPRSVWTGAGNLVSTEIRSWTVQPVVSRYTDLATRPIYIYIYIYLYTYIYIYGVYRMAHSKAVHTGAVCSYCESILQSWQLLIPLSVKLLQPFRFPSFCIHTKGCRLDSNNIL